MDEKQLNQLSKWASVALVGGPLVFGQYADYFQLHHCNQWVMPPCPTVYEFAPAYDAPEPDYSAEVWVLDMAAGTASINTTASGWTLPFSA